MGSSVIPPITRKGQPVLISVGATLGWEVSVEIPRIEVKSGVLISVGATLGWEVVIGAHQATNPLYAVLISVGATLGWEVEEPGGDPGYVDVLISVGATLGWEDLAVDPWPAPIKAVLISVGATLGWEVLGSGKVRPFHYLCFNLRWSDVGVGSRSPIRCPNSQASCFNLRWSDVGVGSYVQSERGQGVACSFNLRWSDVGVGRPAQTNARRGRDQYCFNLRWSDVGVGRKSASTWASILSRYVLISVGATLG